MIHRTKGNMFDFITHRWNPVVGKCSHDCVYCYMKRFKSERPARLKESEFKADLGEGNSIFVVTGADLFAADIPAQWIERTLAHCRRFLNVFLFQSKNPRRMLDFWSQFPGQSIIGTTIETNRESFDLSRAPSPWERARALDDLNEKGLRTMVTVEPIVDFDMDEMVSLIKIARPDWVNIGANSRTQIKLSEPDPDKVRELISRLEKFTRVKRKKNLSRLFKD